MHFIRAYAVLHNISTDDTLFENENILNDGMPVDHDLGIVEDMEDDEDDRDGITKRNAR